jgi:ElaB/YqjD/DUF883 family membrane-anchored ribosome-binding protein
MATKSPPPREACQARATADKAKISTTEKIVKVRKALFDANNKLVDFRWGASAKNFLKAVSSDVLSTVDSTAEAVSQNVLGAVSQASSFLFAQLFAALIRVVLSAPTALFSFVAIPYGQAVKTTDRERVYLYKAKRNLTNLQSIASRWHKNTNGPDYYKQISDANKYVKAAMVYAKSLLSKLELDSENDNGYFDEGDYSGLKSNLEHAIKLTVVKPYSNSGFNISQVVENNKQSIYNRNIKIINTEYAAKKKNISKTYTSRLQDASNTTSSKRTMLEKTGSSYNEDGLKTDYQYQITALNSWYELKKTQTASDAQYKAYLNGSNYVKAYDGESAQFVFDMNYMMKELSDFVENVRKATEYYNTSRSYCNRVYNTRTMVKNLIDEVLYLMRQTSALSKDSAIAIIEKANALIEMANSRLTKAIALTYTPTQSCLTITQCHQLLVTSDKTLNASITSELIRMINSPEDMNAEMIAFNDFIKRLEDIKDFDGNPKNWVEMKMAVIPPFIDLIATATSMSYLVPLNLTSNKKKDRDNINKLFSKSQNILSTMIAHNNTVRQTLNSYKPYNGSDIGDFTSLLSKLGCLGTFAKFGSILMVAAEITIKSIGPVLSRFNPSTPTTSNCKKAYPELYPKEFAKLMSKNSAVQSMMLPSAFANSERQKSMERNALDIVGIKGALTEHSFGSINDSDLLNNTTQIAQK